MPSGRRRIRSSPSPCRCLAPPTFYQKYSKKIIISAMLVLTGAAFFYFSVSQDLVVKHHIHMIEKRLSEIVTSLPLLKRVANSVQNNVRKCTINKDEELRAVVKEELDNLNADKTGKPDFALESAGGTVISTRETESYNSKTLSLFGIPLCTFTNNGPNALIRPGVMPGECWSFKGQEGSSVIQLVTKIYVTGVSVEHIPRNISPTGETSSAPKEFSIWGMKAPDDEDKFFFGQYTYDGDGPTVQFFSVVHRCLRMYDVIEFMVHSNHGHPEYTCVYRLRVHGDLEEN